MGTYRTDSTTFVNDARRRITLSTTPWGFLPPVTLGVMAAASIVAVAEVGCQPTGNPSSPERPPSALPAAGATRPSPEGVDARLRGKDIVAGNPTSQENRVRFKDEVPTAFPNLAQTSAASGRAPGTDQALSTSQRSNIVTPSGGDRLEAPSGEVRFEPLQSSSPELTAWRARTPDCQSWPRIELPLQLTIELPSDETGTANSPSHPGPNRPQGSWLDRLRGLLPL